MNDTLRLTEAEVDEMARDYEELANTLRTQHNAAVARAEKVEVELARSERNWKRILCANADLMVDRDILRASLDAARALPKRMRDAVAPRFLHLEGADPLRTLIDELEAALGDARDADKCMLVYESEPGLGDEGGHWVVDGMYNSIDELREGIDELREGRRSPVAEGAPFRAYTVVDLKLHESTAG